VVGRWCTSECVRERQTEKEGETEIGRVRFCELKTNILMRHNEKISKLN